MEKLFTKAREGEQLVINLNKHSEPKGLVFVLHGLGASKDSPYIEKMAQAFYDKGFTTVCFDNRHSVNESEGEYKDVNFTNTYHDLEDIIDWAKKQDWYMEPFALAGHSMGAGAILWYGANNEDKVLALAPISTVIGGTQTLKKFEKQHLTEYADADRKLSLKEKMALEIRWYKFKKDILKYDIVPFASKFKVPFLMVVGSEDVHTPLEDQMKVYKDVLGEKEIHVIEGARHTFVEENHLQELQEIIENWIDNKVLK